jgi:hypothetical protein
MRPQRNDILLRLDLSYIRIASNEKRTRQTNLRDCPISASFS